MSVRVEVKGDFTPADIEMIENYLSTLIQESTGQPMGRVTYHGIHNQRLDELREQVSGTDRSYNQPSR